MTIRRLGPTEWQRWRDFRLAMLREAPYAFGSTYAEAVTFGDQEWQERTQRLAATDDSVLYVAEQGPDTDSTWLACAGGYVEEGMPNVFGVWTRPEARGNGYAEQCVRHVVDWARAKGKTEIRLWATDGNDAARRVYERIGFAPNGNTQPLPSDPSRTESEYALRL